MKLIPTVELINWLGGFKLSWFLKWFLNNTKFAAGNFVKISCWLVKIFIGSTTMFMLCKIVIKIFFLFGELACISCE